MELTQNRIGSAALKMKEGAAELGASVLDKGNEFKAAALGKGRAVLDKGAELKDAAIEKGRVVYEKGAQKAKEYHAQGAEAIKTRPYTSVLAAFGIGAALGGLAIYLATSKRK